MKKYITWDDVNRFIEAVTELHKKTPFTGVYGVPRGGLVPAVLISYKLDIPLLQAPASNCLIVDDIADSGRTLYHYTDNDTQFNRYTIATICYHPRSLVKPDLYIYEKDIDWIVFPWEE